MEKFPSRKERRNTLVVVVGPTASGKSELAVTLARKFDGEIVSADSRQVYKELDVGSGKITQKEMMGIPHYLLDVISPKRTFTVAQYQTLADKTIRAIQKRNKLPFLVGGSPFYVYTLIDGIAIPKVKPNRALRRELEKLSVEELQEKLKKLDPVRAKTLRQSSGQAQNPRRLIRALEIILTTGKPVPKLGTATPLFDVLMIGIKRSPQELKARIHRRLLKRLQQGMIEEVENLRTTGLSWKRVEEFGLEYRNVAQYLQGKISKQEMIERIQKESEQFARRQMQWFRRDERIHWIRRYQEAKNLLTRFTK